MKRVQHHTPGWDRIQKPERSRRWHPFIHHLGLYIVGPIQFVMNWCVLAHNGGSLCLAPWAGLGRRKGDWCSYLCKQQLNRGPQCNVQEYLTIRNFWEDMILGVAKTAKHWDDINISTGMTQLTSLRWLRTVFRQTMDVLANPLLPVFVLV